MCISAANYPLNISLNMSVRNFLFSFFFQFVFLASIIIRQICIKAEKKKTIQSFLFICCSSTYNYSKSF